MDKDIFQAINNNLRNDKEKLIKSNQEKDEIIKKLQDVLLENVDSLTNAQVGIGMVLGNVTNVKNKSMPINKE